MALCLNLKSSRFEHPLEDFGTEGQDLGRNEKSTFRESHVKIAINVDDDSLSLRGVHSTSFTLRHGWHESLVSLSIEDTAKGSLERRDSERGRMDSAH